MHFIQTCTSKSYFRLVSKRFKLIAVMSKMLIDLSPKASIVVVHEIYV